MLDKMKASHFVKKYSVQFINANGKVSAPFNFWDNKPHECSQTWQVIRSEFDTMMLENAREQGVTVHQPARVLDVIFEGDQAVGARVQNEDGSQEEVRAQVVVDASGQSTMLQNRFKLRLWDPGAQQGRDLDLLGGSLPRLRAKMAERPWSFRHRTKRVGGGTFPSTTTPSASAWWRPSTIFSKAAAATSRFTTRRWKPAPPSRNASRSAGGTYGYFATKDYSYRSKQVAGEGWVLSATPSAFSIRFIHRACCWPSSRASWPPMPSRRAWARLTCRPSS